MIDRALAAMKIQAVERRGDRVWALCPFHDDRHATNFFVRWKGKRRGQWHCFACGLGGGIRELVERRLKLSERRATKWLRDIAKQEPAQGVAPQCVRVEVRTHLALELEMPSGVCFDPLEDWVTPARDFVVARYGATAEQVARWGMGYAVDGHLAGRVVFPVRNAAGGLASYNARLFAGEGSRFLYPSEADPGFDQDVLLGEHLWGEDRDSIVVVEGGGKALAVERALADGDRSPSALGVLGGSDVKLMHAAKLASFGIVVDLCDNDPSGREASANLRAALARHARYARALLPEGKDPNQVSPEALRKVVLPWLA